MWIRNNTKISDIHGIKKMRLKWARHLSRREDGIQLRRFLDSRGFLEIKRSQLTAFYVVGRHDLNKNDRSVHIEQDKELLRRKIAG